MFNGNRMLIKKKQFEKIIDELENSSAKEPCACYDLFKSYIQGSFIL